MFTCGGQDLLRDKHPTASRARSEREPISSLLMMIRASDADAKKNLRSLNARSSSASLIRWTALALARASTVGVATIRRAEVIDGEIQVSLADEAAICRAFEIAGIEFIEDNDGGRSCRQK